MKIDFHVHTSASHCSNMSIYTAVGTAIKKGLSGIAICNHDRPFCSSDIPADMQDRFNISINPKEHCGNAFYIISGEELSTENGHFLRLFLSDDSSPIIVAAHPFEQVKEYRGKAEELLKHCESYDLVECYSGRANYKNKDACNMAIRFCGEHSVPQCAGSDAHFPCEIGNAWVEFSDDVFGLDAIKDALLNNNCKFFYKNAKRITIAKSQIAKKPCIKSIAFWCYCLICDIGDKICQR